MALLRRVVNDRHGGFKANEALPQTDEACFGCGSEADRLERAQREEFFLARMRGTGGLRPHDADGLMIVDIFSDFFAPIIYVLHLCSTSLQQSNRSRTSLRIRLMHWHFKG
jgi:hypothetical protein